MLLATVLNYVTKQICGYMAQEWLGSMDIKYYESKTNLNWKPILKNITEVCMTVIQHRTGLGRKMSKNTLLPPEIALNHQSHQLATSLIVLLPQFHSGTSCRSWGCWIAAYALLSG